MGNCDAYQKLSEYWLDKFAGQLTDSSLPVDFEQHSSLPYKTKTLGFTVSSDLCNKLNKLSKNLDTLLFSILMAGLKIKLYKTTLNKDITIGTTIHRLNEGVESGNKILAIRDRVNPELMVGQFLLDVKQNISEAYEYQEYPFAELIKKLGLEIKDNRTPLFNVILLLENINRSSNVKSLQKDLTIALNRKMGQIIGTIEYNSDLYRKETIEKFLQDYLTILFLICTDPQQKIQSLIDTINNQSVSFNQLIEGITELSSDQDFLGNLRDNSLNFQTNDADLTIKSVGQRVYYQGSSAQKRMYLLEQFQNGGTAYNVFIPMIIEMDLDIERLKNAFRQIIKLHQAFSTSFEMIDGELMQKINDDVEFELPYIDQCKKDILELANDFVQPFDLEEAPLMRAVLLRDGKRYYLLVDFHHIITDSISQKIFIDHLAKIYAGIEVEPPEFQYVDFSVWQNKLLHSKEYQIQEEYWLSQFTGEISVLNLPTDFPRSAVISFAGDLYNLSLDNTLLEKLRDLTAAEGATFFLTLLAGFYVLLNKFTGHEDIIVGTPISGRNQLEFENIIGLFVNTLALRNYPSKDKSFNDFLTEVIDNGLTAYQYQDYQFDMLIERLNLTQDLSSNPLFDVMFTYQNVRAGQRSFADLQFKPLPYSYEIAKFDLSVDVIESNQGLRIVFGYRTDLFKRETIVRMADCYINILQEVVNSPEIKIKDIEMLSKEEKQKLLFDFNNKIICYPENKTFHQLIEEQVAKTPDNTAVVSNERELTYSDLNKKANILARVLQTYGVKPETIVGIMTGRTQKMIIGVLAILKAGGAYLSIDPRYPQERINYMLQDSGASILLTEKDLFQGDDYQGQVIFFESVQDPEGSSNLSIRNTPDNLVYIVYTSGSTGKPKGVMIQHSHLVNVTTSWRQEYLLNEIEVNVLQVASFSFDVFTADLAKALTNGGKLVICPEDFRMDYPELYALMRRHWITLFNSTPALIIPFMEYVYNEQLPIDNLRLLIIGGDACRVENYRKLFVRYGDKLRIVNVYGVTEVAIDSSYYEEIVENLPGSGNVPIGKPLPNTKMYVLGQDLELKPIGVYGELYIGGDSLARGYLNRPELTDERFIPNPYVPGERLYKTGDVVRWMADGNLEFVGRDDFQVKIRGYRIELGEIENCLLIHPVIKEAVVLDLLDESGQKYLCGYIVALADISILEVKAYLAEKLPEYMVPVRIVSLEKMPLSANGKIDRRALPEPIGAEGIESGISYAAPTTELEFRLINLYEQVLAVQGIGILDNFFALGGHSLKAMQLVSKIFKEFNVKLSLTEFFNQPTIKEIVEIIKQKERDEYYQIEKVSKRDYYPVSSAQKRIFILNQFDPKNIFYNMPGIVKIKGNFEIDRLEQAFSALIYRHESLRTSFKFADGELVQLVKDKVRFKIEVIKALENEITEIIERFIRPFDLQIAPLLRVQLVLLNGEYLLMFDMHHIIADGISMEILSNELIRLYNGQGLPELHIQYTDFTIWQNEFFTTEQFKKQEDYWLKELSGELPILSLQTDYSRPLVKTFAGDLISFALRGEVVESLHQFARTQGVTLHMLILAVFNIVLARWSGQEDIIVGTPISGRIHADLDRVIGMFVNTLALRNYPERDKIFGEFLGQVQKNSLLAYENQDYQFEKLVERLDLARDMSRNPIFDVVFVMQESENTELQDSEIMFAPYEFGDKTAKFDFTLYATRVRNGIDFAIEYSTTLFKSERIGLLGKHVINTIHEVILNPDIRIKEIQMISDEEKDMLLNQFNDIQVTYPENKTIHSLFIDQVRRTPDKIALSYLDQRMTYRELDEYSDRLALHLRDHGVKPETIVGLMLERSLEMVIGIIAIIKSGGAYLPLDPEYPPERIEYMLADSQSAVLIAKIDDLKGLNYSGEVIDIGKMKEPRNVQSLDNINKPTDLLYIIYTSGSTGRPKGVMTEQKNVVRLMFNDRFQFDFTDSDVWTLFHSICFDFSVWEMYGALLYGGRLVIVPKLVAPDPSLYLRLISQEGVTIVNQTPTAFYSLSDRLMSEPDIELKVRYVIFGGEALKPGKLGEWTARFPQTRLVNMYGITETTVHVTFKEITKKEIKTNISNIGKPIPTLRTYVMDKDLNLLPPGAAGELCIGGEGVARGYLNRPELTQEKFVRNPHRPHERLYRSGDLVVMLSDGEYKYLGRIDRQVKIRGFRIELGEIERQLLAHQGVMDALIIEWEHESGDKYLCAYIVAENELSVRVLRDHLSLVLPDYMIPAYFIRLTHLPLTKNGKVDHKALPLEGGMDLGNEYIPPGDEVEEKLTTLCSNILEVERMGITDDFFLLGGHSMKATQLVQAVYREFQVELPLQEVFKTPRMGELASYIKKAAKELTPLLGDGLVMLKKGRTKASNFFLIHDGSGGVEGYIEFCNTLSDKFHYRGIKADNISGYAPINLQIKEIAKKYIRLIKKVQPQGPYNLAGWSIGGTIAFEIANQLEQIGDKLEFFAMFDTYHPVKTDYREFNLAEEKGLIRQYLSEEAAKELEELTTMEEAWEYFANYVKENNLDLAMIGESINSNMLRIIPDFAFGDIEKLVYHVNLIRSYDLARDLYLPERILQTEVNFFKASKSKDDGIENWNLYTSKTVKVYTITGDHFSIFKVPGVFELGNIFEKVTLKNFND